MTTIIKQKRKRIRSRKIIFTTNRRKINSRAIVTDVGAVRDIFGQC